MATLRRRQTTLLLCTTHSCDSGISNGRQGCGACQTEDRRRSDKKNRRRIGGVCCSCCTLFLYTIRTVLPKAMKILHDISMMIGYGTQGAVNSMHAHSVQFGQTRETAFHLRSRYNRGAPALASCQLTMFPALQPPVSAERDRELAI